MFLKTLKIENQTGLIRRIDFHKGLNLIVDNTPSKDESTGNNVGKTTVLRLVDYCLGAEAKTIFTDSENKNTNDEVKNFLISTKVLLTLTLVSNLDNDGQTCVIERNFLSRKESVCRINGKNITKDDFEDNLAQVLLGSSLNKPSFRQVISHNIRIDDYRIENALKTLNSFAKDVEYETLHLFLFGCNFEQGERRQEISRVLDTERGYKRRLEKDATKSMLKSSLALVEADIVDLEKKKDSLNLNPDFEADLAALNQIQFQMTKIGAELNQKLLRRDLIAEAVEELKKGKSDIDTKQLALIYSQTKKWIPNLQKSFEELVDFHNQMADQKAQFISVEIPSLNAKVEELQIELKKIQEEEARLSGLVKKSVSFESMNALIAELNRLYKEKGGHEATIKQIEDSEQIIADNEKLLQEIDQNLFSLNKQNLIQKQLDKFNHYFASISKELYDERYAIQFEVKKDKNAKQCYKFSPYSANFSTGKKQGEVTCFELAYTQFADTEHIPCLHFSLNDKKELVHDNQLTKIGSLSNEFNNVQYVASILRDKLPTELNNTNNIILELSQNDKLLRF